MAPMRTLTAAFLGVAGAGAVVAEEATCASPDAPGCSAEDESSLLSLHKRRKSGRERRGDEETRQANRYLSQMSRKDKYNFVRGTGWKEGSWDQIPGFYIGDAGVHEPLGIPSLNMQDGGQGFRTIDKRIIGQVTSWPSTLAISATWDEEMTGKWAKAMAKEFRAKGANMILGPGLNVARVARNGRNAEYSSGEEGYLGARLAPPYVHGVQSEHVLAVMKHYLNNNQETNRNDVDSIVDERTEWEVYLPPFEAGVKAGAAAIMCGYNQVNNEHACGNSHILVTDLKETMGYEGWVMSDWWALHSFVAKEGVDQEMPGTSSGSMPFYFTDKNLDTLTDEKLDTMVRPMLVMMQRHGLFDTLACQPGECDKYLYEVNATSAEHKALSRELATQGVVLLKNEKKTLPLKANAKIGVIGSACSAESDVEKMLSTWDLGNYYYVGGSGRVIGPDPVTITRGVQEMCAEKGCEVHVCTDDTAEAATKLVEENNLDVAIICAGAWSTEGTDRASLSVDQEPFMIAAAAALKGKVPIVSATMTPGGIVMPWVDDIDAAVNIFLGGDATGYAIADVLFGVYNPGAKTPLTFPVHESDMPAPCLGMTCEYTEKLMVGWRALQDKPVTFPFGHGLSYTTFEYRHIDFLQSTDGVDACTDAKLCVKASIKNTGDVKGTEIAQLYLGFPHSAGEPAKVLRGFVLVSDLAPGETRELHFPLVERDVQIYEVAMKGWKSPNGKYDVYVGSSSRDIRWNMAFSMCEGQVNMDADAACGAASKQVPQKVTEARKKPVAARKKPASQTLEA